MYGDRDSLVRRRAWRHGVRKDQHITAHSASAPCLDTEDNVTRYPCGYYVHRADVWGDSREELIIAARNGVRIVTNSRPLAIPTLYNSTTYNGM